MELLLFAFVSWFLWKTDIFYCLFRSVQRHRCKILVVFNVCIEWSYFCRSERTTYLRRLVCMCNCVLTSKSVPALCFSRLFVVLHLNIFVCMLINCSRKKPTVLSLILYLLWCLGVVVVTPFILFRLGRWLSIKITWRKLNTI